MQPFLLHKPFSFLLLLFLFPLQFCCNGSSVVPAVIVFGDSVVDTGNNNNLQTIFKVNYPPYGQDFSGGQPTGRFSNGKVPSDFVVEELGVKGVLPPYLGPNLQIEDLLTGVNFASGGGGYDPLTSELASVISLEGQIELFKEYLEKVKTMAGEDVANTILSKGLFILATGSNDVTNTYFKNPLRKYHYDFESYTGLLVNSASSFLQNLYNLGARRIGIFGVPPIGCLPSQRTLEGGTLRECAQKYNELAVLFNTKLSMEINYLNLNLPFARMVYIDGYYLPLDIIQNPTKYGFDISNIGCCGTGTIEDEGERYIHQRPIGRDSAKKAAYAGSSGKAKYMETFEKLSDKLEGLMEIEKQRMDLGKEKLQMKKDKEMRTNLKVLTTDYSHLQGPERELAEQVKQRIKQKYGL